MNKPNDPALAVLNKVRAGFWPSDKELEEAAAHLGKQERRIEELQAGLNNFAKIGALALHDPLTPMLDYGSLQINYGDFIRAAKLLYPDTEK